VATLYEFAPRGVAANWLFQQYPASLAAAANPFLNNAKAVDRLDLAWAAVRTDYPAAAHALVRVVEGLESMGFSARKELAAWLRWWIHRGLRLQAPPATQVTEMATPKLVGRVLAAVQGQETNTVGIVEQRVVDALSAVRHPAEEGWRARGLGDSVNASNISRRKLGDADFQDAARRSVVAYEAHAGVLSHVYLRGHLQTLARVLPVRAQEWAGISDIEEWSIEVIFVAHAFAPGVPVAGTSVRVPGVPIDVSIRFSTMSDFIADGPGAAELTGAFVQHIHSRLNERRTPERVRTTYAQICGG
jgi:hypothetical protein